MIERVWVWISSQLFFAGICIWAEFFLFSIQINTDKDSSTESGLNATTILVNGWSYFKACGPVEYRWSRNTIYTFIGICTLQCGLDDFQSLYEFVQLNTWRLVKSWFVKLFVCKMVKCYYTRVWIAYCMIKIDVN